MVHSIITDKILFLSLEGDQVHQEICKHFTASLKKVSKMLPELELVSARSLQARDVDRVLKKVQLLKPKLVVSVGFFLTKAFLGRCELSGVKIPTVAISVDNLAGLVPQFLSDVVTGVSTAQDTTVDRSARLLRYIKPSLRKVAIIHCSTIENLFVTEQLAAISTYFKKNLIEFRVVSQPTEKDMLARLKEYIRTVDTVMTLEADAFAQYYKKIVVMCKKEGVTFFSGALPAVFDGAALGYGFEVFYVAQEAAQYVHKILVKHIPPGKLPIKELANTRRLYINKKECFEQDLPIDRVTWHIFEQACMFYATNVSWEKTEKDKE